MYILGIGLRSANAILHNLPPPPPLKKQGGGEELLHKKIPQKNLISEGYFNLKYL